MLLFKLLQVRKEAREWKSEPDNKLAELGIDAIGFVLTIPVLIAALFTIPAGIGVILTGSVILSVIFWFGAIVILGWTLLGFGIRSLVKNLTRRTVTRVREQVKTRPTSTSDIIDIPAEDI
jgi:hypothetical protein